MSCVPRGATAVGYRNAGPAGGRKRVLTGRICAGRPARAGRAPAGRRHVRHIPQAVQRPLRRGQVTVRLGGKPPGLVQVMGPGGCGSISERGRRPVERVPGDHLVELLRHLVRVIRSRNCSPWLPRPRFDQLGRFRAVFESALLPALGNRPGMWAIGPTFAGSALMAGDADLVAGGLLADLKTGRKLSLAVTDLFQLLGYGFMDYDDEFAISAVAVFSARYSYLATWELGDLLSHLAGHPVSLAAVRGQFRDLLLRHAPAR
jgi:hypothetical protein